MRRITHSIMAGFAVLMLETSVVRAELKTETITYRVGDREFTGYLAYDDAGAGRKSSRNSQQSRRDSPAVQ